MNVKASFFLKFTHRFNTIPIKITTEFFVDSVKFILKFISKRKRVRITNTIFKKNKWRVLLQTDIKAMKLYQSNVTGERIHTQINRLEKEV